MSKLLASFLFALAITIFLVACDPPESLLRHVAEYRFGPEQYTNQIATGVGTGGIAVYTKTFNLPSNQHTVFITLSTTGDGHGGASNLFSASVNGQVCNKGDEGASGAPGGWIPLQRHNGTDDLHDNGIYYTWCCTDGVRPGGANRVEIRLASSIAGQYVFMERSHFYIDSVATTICTQVDRDPAQEAAAESLRSKLPASHQHPPEQPSETPK